MKSPLFPTLILIAASLAVLQPGGKPAWSSVAPSFQEMERQVKFGLENLKTFRFQAPTLSPFSIPYLTIKEVREEANLQAQVAVKGTSSR